MEGETNQIKMSFFKRKKDSEPQFYATVAEGLKKIYKGKLLPLEETYDFHEFVSPALNEPDFDAKPMVLLVGQYSTGKTSFIRYLLERDFPGIRIGPEPTTDAFTAVMYGENEQVRSQRDTTQPTTPALRDASLIISRSESNFLIIHCRSSPEMPWRWTSLNSSGLSPSSEELSSTGSSVRC